MRQTLRGRSLRFLLGCAALAALAACSSTTAGHPVAAGSSGSRPAASTGSSSEPAGSPSSSAGPVGAAFPNAERVEAMLAAAGGAVTVINQYDYRDLDGYRDYALRLTTEPLTTTLGQAIDTIVANAPRLHASQTATILRAGVAALEGNEATVLIFGELTVTNTTYPRGRLQSFGAVAGVRFVAGDWKLSRIAVDGSATCSPPGTPDVTAACRAAADGAAAITTLRRATFDQDFDRALALLTDPLRTDFAGKKASTRKALVRGNFDLHGDVVAAAVQSVAPDEVTALVTLRESRSRRDPADVQHLAITVKDVAGHWLLSNVTSIGAS